MNRKILLILLIILLPISCFAEENIVLEKIKEIENTMVDEAVFIKNTEVKDDTIVFHMEENETQKDVEIPYKIEDSTFTWIGGQVPLIRSLNSETQEEEITIGNLTNNEYAFYLYNILNSLSSISYEEENYYNDAKIIDTINHLLEENKIENQEPIILKDSSNAFMLTLIPSKIEEEWQYDIKYSYNFESNVFLSEVQRKEIIPLETNPNTSNYSMMITMTLIFVIGVAAYTVVDPKKEK